MFQDWLNHVALLHVCLNVVEDLDIVLLMDEFIVKENKRASVFALSKK